MKFLCLSLFCFGSDALAFDGLKSLQSDFSTRVLVSALNGMIIMAPIMADKIEYLNSERIQVITSSVHGNCRCRYLVSSFFRSAASSTVFSIEVPGYLFTVCFV